MISITALLLLVSATILQNSIVTRLNMLYGAADLVLLVLLAWVLHMEDETSWPLGLAAGALMGLSSAIPFWIPVATYFGVVIFVNFLQRRVWQVPVWLMIVSTFFSTLGVYGVEIVYLWVTDVGLNVGEVVNLVLLPSLLLNMIIIFPVYYLVGEVVKLVYPEKEDV